MIYLIGGAPRIGKTQLAKKLSGKTGYSWITTDNLRQGLTYLEEINKNHPIKRYWINWDDENYPQNLFDYPIQETIKRQNNESVEVAKLVRGVVESLNYLNRDFIIEGVALLPTFFEKQFLKRNKIKFVCVGNTHFQSLFEYSWKHRTDGDWLADVDKKTFRKAIRFSSQFSKEFKKQAKNNNLPYFEIHASTFLKDIEEIANKLEAFKNTTKNK